MISAKEFFRLGFNDNEKEVYLAILHAGKIAAHKVSTLTGINRTTVYSIGKKLAGLGLVSEDKGQKVSYFVAERPEKILSMVEREESKIKEKKQSAQNLIKELLLITSEKHYSVPRIKFIEDDDLSAYLYKQYEVLSASGLQHDNTWWGYHDSSFTENYNEYVDWTWTHGPPGLKVRFLTNSMAQVEEEMKKKHPERRFKTLTPENEFDSSLWVIGDYVIMGQTRVRPHYLVEIHDEVLARNQRALFKGLWDFVK